MRITNTTLKKILLGLCVVVIVGCSSISPSGGSPNPDDGEQDTKVPNNTDGEQDIAPTTIPDDGEQDLAPTTIPAEDEQVADQTPIPAEDEQDLDQTPIPAEDEQDTDTETFTGTYEEHALGGHTLIVQGSEDDQTKVLEIAPTTTIITRGSFGSSSYNTQPLITIQRLIIPNSVRSIGIGAFRNNKLTELTIPNSVTSIGFDAFYKNKLTELTIPDSVQSIGAGAFWENELTTLKLPTSGSLTIGEYAFYKNKLTELTIPDSVTSIRESAFYDNKLTELTIPISVTSIGRDAFGANPDLKNVTIPRGAYNRLGAEVLRQAFPSNPTFRDENGNAY